MSEKWIQRSKRVMDRIRELEKVEEKDRLELVRSLRFMLGALYRSLRGWTQWVGNPDIMAKYTKDELDEMNKKLSEFTRSFIEYDLEVTKTGAEKGLKARETIRRRRREGAEIFYV